MMKRQQCFGLDTQKKTHTSSEAIKDPEVCLYLQIVLQIKNLRRKTTWERGGQTEKLVYVQVSREMCSSVCVYRHVQRFHEIT